MSVIEKIVAPIDIAPGQLPPGMPPLLKVDRGIPSLVMPPAPEASTLTHPVVVGIDPTRLAFIETSGDLVLWENGEIGRLSLDLPPDARLLQDENGRLLVISGASTRYQHAVLGDGIEGASLTLVETTPTLNVIWTNPMPEGKVIEGIAPIWTDLDGDGEREIIVTLSNDADGAQLVVFDETGARIAAGPAIGRGFRWRHQLLAAPFGEDGGVTLVDLLTPHIGGIVEFYQWAGDQLEVVAQFPGYSSHRLGSRNLDMALAGDLDGDEDGIVELLVPDQNMGILTAIRYENGSPSVAWAIELEGHLTTNMAAVTLQNGLLAVGVGLDNNVLRIWLP